MIQLFINGKECDIDKEFDIKLEKDFDMTDIHVIEESEYSFEIELPITKRNREAFGFVDAFDVSNKFGQVYDAVLNADESNVLVGKFIMEEIENDKYSGNLYVPKRKTLKDVLGDKKMKDIKEHPMYISSWGDIKKINDRYIYNRTGDRHIAFPYILYRLPYNYTGSTLPITTQDLSASGSTFTLDNVFPAYNVLSVIKDIFDSEGYKVQGNVFGIEKFTELYQTFGGTQANDYADNKLTPYYLSFKLKYSNRWGAYSGRSENTSSTLQAVDLFDDPQMKVGADALLLSDNCVIENEKDDYNMLVKGTNSDARTIVVPHSGWYEIRAYGEIHFPTQNGRWEQDNRIDICGCYNDADRVDFSQNMVEFQIKKTSTPLQSIQFYSMNLGTPMIPSNISKGDIKYNPSKESDFSKPTWMFSSMVGVLQGYEAERNKYAKNTRTAIVKDYSGYDTSEFIAGARWGCVWNAISQSSDRCENKKAPDMVYSCLPNPSKAFVTTMTDDATKANLPIMWFYWTNGIRQSDGDSKRFDYGSKTAQILVRDDSYSNFDGYNRFTPPTQGSGGTWDTSSFERRRYAGQYDNFAKVYSGNRGGVYSINTCVWLEKGDNISLELIMPWNDYADECGWLETCSYKHFYKAGVTHTRMSCNFEMGIVSSQKDWIPTDTDPIPTYEQVRTPKMTNVNQWLGDTKVNDYLENFLNTFNLKLTKVNSTTYSIDTMSNENDTYGNIIDIDKWANVKDAKFVRLNTKNTSLEWTISTDEEGYVHGNDTRMVKTKRDEPKYTGGVSFYNEADTSADEEKVKSNWSYTWLKDITFENGDVAFRQGVKEVPVIGDAELWKQNYISIKDKDFATDKTSRLIYLDKDPNSHLYNYFNVHGYKNDSLIDEVKAPLLFCKNYITYKNNLNLYKTFRLDYDNELSTKTDQTITDVFFNIRKGHQYEVDVPVKLPNAIYESIRANTLVKFNDALFKVVGIEGHDVSMNDEATLKLLTLD